MNKTIILHGNVERVNGFLIKITNIFYIEKPNPEILWNEKKNTD